MQLGLEGTQDFLDTVYGDVLPTTRADLLAEWESDPTSVLQKAREADMPTDSYCNARAAPTAESPGSAVDFLLYNSGARMVDTWNVPSSKMDDLPTIIPEQGAKVEPLAQLMNAYWDEAYNYTLMTGKTKAANSLSPIESQTIWRPIREEMPFRQPQISPAFNFMDILAFSRRIREDQYRLNKWANKSKEQMMQELAEGTEPRLFELERAKQQFDMTSYRAGIEATDSFLNDPQVRASDITNAVEEIAIGHRIILLRKACKTIVDATPSSQVFNAKTGVDNPYLGVTYAQGRMDWPRYTFFRTKSGTAYTFDCCIGNEQSIISLENMSITDGTNVTFGSWTMAPNSNIRKFNGSDMSLGYGWVDKDAETGFADNKLWFFQRMTTLGFVQRMGMDQDELERVPGPRKVRRWLGTESLFCEIDKNGMWQYDSSAAT